MNVCEHISSVVRSPPCISRVRSPVLARGTLPEWFQSSSPCWKHIGWRMHRPREEKRVAIPISSRFNPLPDTVEPVQEDDIEIDSWNRTNQHWRDIERLFRCESISSKHFALSPRSLFDHERRRQTFVTLKMRVRKGRDHRNARSRKILKKDSPQRGWRWCRDLLERLWANNTNPRWIDRLQEE